MANNIQSLPTWKKVMYAMGQFGWSLASYSVANLITYFYMPPETGAARIFPVFIFTGAIIFGLTVIGVINFGGRIFDAVTDPIIAGLSDRSKSKFGKRRLFLAISAFPFAALSFLVFFPIAGEQGVLNTIWLAVSVVLFYLFMTMYVTPYFALVSELGHTPKERLTLSTLISVTWALGFALGSQAYLFQGLFEQALVPADVSVQIVGSLEGVKSSLSSVSIQDFTVIQQLQNVIANIDLNMTSIQAGLNDMQMILKDTDLSSIFAVHNLREYIHEVNIDSLPSIQELSNIKYMLSRIDLSSLHELQTIKPIESLRTLLNSQNLQEISTNSLQYTILSFSGLAFIAMMLPVIFINEKKYSEPHISKEGSFQAVKSAFSNKNFRYFTISDLAYWLSLTFIQIGISYYITILLGLPKEMASQYMLVTFLTSFIFYVPVNLIAQKIGKKKLMIIGFIVFAVTFTLTAIMGYVMFIPPVLYGYIVMVIAGIPMAIFGILPNAIVADIAESDGIKTGNFKAGVFFAGRTFMQKMGMSIANLIFPSLLLLGNSITNDTGVRVSAVAALIFCIAGLLLFLKYDEVNILKTLATKENLTEEELEEIEEKK